MRRIDFENMLFQEQFRTNQNVKEGVKRSKELGKKMLLEFSWVFLFKFIELYIQEDYCSKKRG